MHQCAEIDFRGFNLKLGGFCWGWSGVRLLLWAKWILTQFIAIFLYLMRVVLRRFKQRCVIHAAIESLLMILRGLGNDRGFIPRSGNLNRDFSRKRGGLGLCWLWIGGALIQAVIE